MATSLVGHRCSCCLKPPFPAQGTPARSERIASAARRPCPPKLSRRHPDRDGGEPGRLSAAPEDAHRRAPKGGEAMRSRVLASLVAALSMCLVSPTGGLGSTRIDGVWVEISLARDALGGAPPRSLVPIEF